MSMREEKRLPINNEVLIKVDDVQLESTDSSESAYVVAADAEVTFDKDFDGTMKITKIDILASQKTYDVIDGKTWNDCNLSPGEQEALNELIEKAAWKVYDNKTTIRIG